MSAGLARKRLLRSAGGNSFHRGRTRTPSTACGRSPSLEERGLWGGGTGERASIVERVRRVIGARCAGTPSTACGRGTRSARPRGLGGDFEFLPLKSPRNPITPIETSRVATLHPGLYKGLREGGRRGIGRAMCGERLPPPAGGPPPSKREVWGGGYGKRASFDKEWRKREWQISIRRRR